MMGVVHIAALASFLFGPGIEHPGRRTVVDMEGEAARGGEIGDELIEALPAPHRS